MPEDPKEVTQKEDPKEVRISVARLLRILGRIKEDIKESHQRVIDSSFKDIDSNTSITEAAVKIELKSEVFTEMGFVEQLLEDDLYLKGILDIVNIAGGLMVARRELEFNRSFMKANEGIETGTVRRNPYGYAQEGKEIIRVSAFTDSEKRERILQIQKSIRVSQDRVAELNGTTTVLVLEEIVKRY